MGLSATTHDDQCEPILPPGFPTRWADVTVGQYIELDKFSKGNSLNPAELLAILYAAPEIDGAGMWRLDIGDASDRTSVLGMFTELVATCHAYDLEPALHFLLTSHGYDRSPSLTQITLGRVVLTVPHSAAVLQPELRATLRREMNTRHLAGELFAALILVLYEYNLAAFPEITVRSLRAAVMGLPLYYVFSTAKSLYKSAIAIP
jgi:hypothetical protein